MIWFKHTNFRLFSSLLQDKDITKVPIDLSHIPVKMPELMSCSGSERFVEHLGILSISFLFLNLTIPGADHSIVK
jgi:hypothetical protein